MQIKTEFGGKATTFISLIFNKFYKFNETKLLNIPWGHRADAGCIALLGKEAGTVPGSGTQDPRMNAHLHCLDAPPCLNKFGMNHCCYGH